MVTGITDSTSVTAAFGHTILLNRHSVHMLCEGNGSQWWEMMRAIYRALKILLLPSQSESAGQRLEREGANRTLTVFMEQES